MMIGDDDMALKKKYIYAKNWNLMLQSRFEQSPLLSITCASITRLVRQNLDTRRAKTEKKKKKRTRKQQKPGLPALPYVLRQHPAHDGPVVAGAAGVPLGEHLGVALPEDTDFASDVLVTFRPEHWPQQRRVRHLVLRVEVLLPREALEVVGLAGLAEGDRPAAVVGRRRLDAEQDDVVEVAPPLCHRLHRRRLILPEHPARGEHGTHRVGHDSQGREGEVTGVILRILSGLLLFLHQVLFAHGW